MRLIALALALAGICVVAAPRIAAAQLPPSDVTVADARSNGGLRLTIFSAASLGPETNPSLLIGVEVHGVAEMVRSEDGLPRQLELSYVAESGGSPLARHSATFPLTDGDTVRRAAEQGARVLTRMTLGAGRYALRVTARDSGNRTTVSVVRDLEVPNLTGAPITMSDLVMSASRVGGVTHPEPEEDELLPLVGRPPTGRRQFSRSEKVEVNADIYEAPTCDGLGGSLSIATRLLTPEGRVVHEAVDSGSSETLPNGVFGYQHYALVPIATLPPGPYILHVSVSVDGAASAFRSVPISVVP